MLTIAALGFGLVVIPACEKHGHEDDAQHGESATFTDPHSFAEAVNIIHEQLEKIDTLIDTGKLDRVHAEAAVIRDVANLLPKLALEKDSGVPSGAVREINLTSKDLAAKFGPIDEAGDSGDLAGTKKVYAEMMSLFEVLEKYADLESVQENHDHD